MSFVSGRLCSTSFTRPTVRCVTSGSHRMTGSRCAGSASILCWPQSVHVATAALRRKAPSSSGSSCPNCVSWRGIHFDRALVLADFSGVAGDAIHSLKFSGIKKIGPFLGRQMAGHPDLRAGLAALDLLIPVPLHAARQRERGYNQAKEIALGLSESLGIPLDDGCVRRCRPTRQQARLDASERAANTDGAFETMRSPLGSPARIGLVDDVLTTGATLSACASALSRATGAHVIGLAVASPFR